MKINYIAFFFLLSLFAGQEVYSQKKSSKKDKKASVGSSATKNWGVGLRLGDPLGLTVKKYFNDKMALEFNLGKTFFWGSGYNSYYRYRGGKYPNNNIYYYKGNPYDNGRYIDGNPYYHNGYYYYEPRAVSIQLHLLAHKSIASVEGLQLYYGAGPQLRILSYNYGYYINYPVGPQYYEEIYRQVGGGLDGIFGTEYTFASLPMTVFADINLYMEIAPVPFWLGIQGGVGARFNF